MSEELGISPDFHIYYPVYTLWNKDAHGPVALVAKRESKAVMLLFTDQDLVERWLSTNKRDVTEWIAIHHPKSLVAVAEMLKSQKGVTDVGIDAKFFGPIDPFIETVRASVADEA